MSRDWGNKGARREGGRKGGREEGSRLSRGRVERLRLGGRNWEAQKRMGRGGQPGREGLLHWHLCFTLFLSSYVVVFKCMLSFCFVAYTDCNSFLLNLHFLWTTLAAELGSLLIQMIVFIFSSIFAFFSNLCVFSPKPPQILSNFSFPTRFWARSLLRTHVRPFGS